MTPNQKTRKQGREIEQFYRVLKYHINECQDRIDRLNNIADRTPVQAQIRDHYFNLLGLQSITRSTLEEVWERLEAWSIKHAMPTRYDSPLNQGNPPIRLKLMMATNNVLTDDQVNNYVVVEDLFTPRNAGKNRYQRLLEIVDSFADMVTIFTRRMNWWINEWEAQGSTPRENEVMSILCELADGAGALRSATANLQVAIRDGKGEDDTTVDELRLRNRLLKRRALIVGGIQSIKRDTTTATGLPPGPEPDEYNPDIDTNRDEPDMGTDVPDPPA